MGFKTKLSKLQKSSYLKLGNLALQTGHIKGHVAYKKFIILGWARTGSNFLRGLLNSNHQIIAFNEIFREYDSIDWGIPGFNSNSTQLLSLIQDDPIKFIETKVFKEYPKQISAVGFKLFYYHARNEAWEPIWPYLQKNQDVSIIHLKRRNILKTYLSEMRARQTGQWVNTTGSDTDQTAIALDYHDCLEKFTTVRAEEKKHDVFFENSCKLEVLYEDLISDYAGESDRIQKFLGVDGRVLTPSTYKQTTRPLSKSISKYFELKEKFSGTEWAEFFQD